MYVRGREFIVLAIAAGLTVFMMFLGWQVVEDTWGTTLELRHSMHLARGVSSSLVTAGVVAWLSLRHRQERLAELEHVVAERTAEATRANRLLRLVVDHTPAALLLLDEDREIIYCNRTAERVHGEQLEGRVCSEVLDHNGERCAVCPGRESMRLGCSAVGKAQYTEPRTGEILTLESHPVQLPNGKTYLLLVENVVTEQRKLEASLLHQEKMAAFGLLAAGVAHEMGNPLSSIEMHLQLIDTASMQPEDADSIRTVREETARLRRTLRELVDFARRRRDEATAISMSSVVDDALRLLRYDRRMRGVAVVVEHDAEAPPVYAVEDHIVQVVLNLLINALDAMPDGGTLRIDTRRIGGKVSLRVRDTGHGMDRATLDRCFEPLFTTKEAGKGTGLGLSICRDVLRAAGGDIELHSARGAGTTAVVTLPAADVARPDSGRHELVQLTRRPGATVH